MAEGRGRPPADFNAASFPPLALASAGPDQPCLLDRELPLKARGALHVGGFQTSRSPTAASQQARHMKKGSSKVSK